MRQPQFSNRLLPLALMGIVVLQSILLAKQSISDKISPADVKSVMGTSTQPAIPQKLIFVHTRHATMSDLPKNFYDNVQNTINLYRNLWGNQEAPVIWASDKECREAINGTEPRLLPFYGTMRNGAVKSDLCRSALLYQHGGYYHDNDVETLQALDVPSETEFVGVVDRTGAEFTNMVIAIAPKHVILRRTFDVMLAFFNNGPSPSRFLSGFVGCWTLRTAFTQIPPSERGDTIIMREASTPWLYPYRPVQNGTGNLCNFYIADEHGHIHFFARFIGGHGQCQHPPNATNHEQSK